MNIHETPIDFGMALEQNTAAMNRYAHLSQAEKQNVLQKARNASGEKEMYALVADLANGIL